ncbi:glycosyltransferase [Neobacillus drentensis]|uniref:glycosyltransferase n=1 Tax=Neobacillus drentensis TaxID=220684 RepID=UPI002FFFB1A5
MMCTIREHMIERGIDNFQRQTIAEKELILILNKNSIQLEKWQSRLEAFENIHVFQLDESKTLGECLNFGARQARFGRIAKFDDDDYYSPAYLANSLHGMDQTDASVIGKAGIFVYFKRDKLLTLFRPQMSQFFLKNKRVFLSGGTLVFKREVLEKVSFRKLNSGEDVQFQKDCLDQRISLYSGGFHDYVLIRYEENHRHTWGIMDETFQKQCKRIAVTDSFENFVRDGGKRL